MILLKYFQYFNIKNNFFSKINASDERTAEKLIERIESITNSESLSLIDKKFRQKVIKRPTMLILDEVDGAVE